MRFKLRKCFIWVVYSVFVYVLWTVWIDNSVNITNRIKTTTYRPTQVTTYRNVQVTTYPITQAKTHHHTNTSISNITATIRNRPTKKCYEQIDLKDNSLLAQIDEERWQPINIHSKEVYVYSAFLVESYAKILVVKVTKVTGYTYCRFWYSGSSDEIKYSLAKFTHIPEGKGKRYTSAFYTCDLPGSANGYPYALSLVTDKCQKPENIVKVRHYTKEDYEFTVCVTPFNFNYSRAYELVEMIELNRILGANHFVFYNYSINKNVNRVLDYYKSKGIVEVLTWNLPMKVDTWPPSRGPVEIHYFAQLGALNDCLFRNMIKSKYLVYQDLDEFIIPRKGKSWREMLTNLPANQAAYTFRNVFFRKEWPDTNLTYAGKDIAKQYKSVTLLKLKRETKILSKTHRAKYIINPKYIDMVGIHNIWRFKFGKSNHYVNQNIGLLHHYRDWEQPNDTVPRTEDRQTLIYKDELLKRLKDTWDNLPNVPLGP